MKLYYHFSKIYKKKNWFELWYSCSNLITSASVEAKFSKRKKINNIINNTKNNNNNGRIFVFLFYQNDICILE